MNMLLNKVYIFINDTTWHLKSDDKNYQYYQIKSVYDTNYWPAKKISNQEFII